MVKRVAHVGGDTVVVLPEELRNDHPRRHRPWMDRLTETTEEGTFELTLTSGEIFVRGDNLHGENIDSSRFGPVPVSAVAGVVLARLATYRYNDRRSRADTRTASPRGEPNGVRK
jgi:type IV secretory pathway protease TraF